MILYIHGFASCGLGQKSRLLMDHYGADQVLAPDLPLTPAGAADFLDHLVTEQPVDLLVGSSLGGYLATWLNRARSLPAVLINPAVRPWQLMEDHVGSHRRWCDGRPFEVTAEHGEQLRALQRDKLRADEHYLVLLHSGDEILDHRDAAAYYRDHDVRIEPGGNHRFENLADHLPAIDAFYREHAAR